MTLREARRGPDEKCWRARRTTGVFRSWPSSAFVPARPSKRFRCQGHRRLPVIISHTHKPVVGSRSSYVLSLSSADVARTYGERARVVVRRHKRGSRVRTESRPSLSGIKNLHYFFMFFFSCLHFELKYI
ncbi:hypothetical protein PUN28_010837 [Cardiocondyla obscurior]|uniref:Uncharacterized protein n=1 Tax=Cardiocondyla obscurior TaxID=286306 RepID=A0AAW2FJI5_9HYME